MTEDPEPERKWLGREAAAAYLGCSPATLDRLARSGRLPRYKVGHLARFDAAEIDALVRASAPTPHTG